MRSSSDSNESVLPILESLSDGFLQLDNDRRIKYVNAALEAQCGKSRATLLGREACQEWPATLGETVEATIRQAATKRLTASCECRDDASRRWFEIKADPLPQGDVAVFCRDITSRKAVEESRSESDERLSLIADAIPALISYVDTEFRYQFCNRAYEVWFQTSLAAILGRPMPEVLGEAAWQAIGPSIRAALAGTKQVLETEVRYARGGTRWIHADYVPHHSKSGEVIGVFVLVQDVTERKRAIESLARERERLAVALHAGRLGIYEWKVGEKDIWWSEETYDVFGVDRHTFRPSIDALMATVHPDDRDLFWRKTEHSLATHEVFVHEYRIICPDGSIRWIFNRSHVALNAAGEVEGITGVAVDITERKLAEQVLREADRKKDEFLATLAHELRNPLAPIRTSVQVLKLRGPKDPQLEASRNIIDRQVTHMARLLDDLLDVSRITRNKLELRKEHVELTSVIEAAVETSRPLIEGAGHQLTLTLPGTRLYLDADSVRLAQTFANLLNNAAKYTDRGGQIWLTAKLDGQSVEVSVRDNGIGIAPDALPHVFEMFSQVSPTIQRSQGGLGIGLSLVKGLVEMHGGSVMARSAGLGHGSEFIVTLPLAGRPIDTIGASQDEAELAAVQKRILVADDNQDAADSLAMLLRLFGAEVQVARDGEEALRFFESFEPQIAILDIGMPKFTGYEVAQRIRQSSKGESLSLVALTGWGQEEDRNKAKEAGFDHHLVKPVSAEALRDMLRNSRGPSRSK